MTRILLVEDSDDHALIITKALEARKGWSVTRAITTKEALLQVARKPFDCAVVDYRLPDGDGIGLLDSLRAQNPGLPVLFLTGHGSEEVAMQAMERGAADYLVKGLHYQKELPGRVEEVLGRAEDYARVGAAVRHSHEAAPLSKGNGFDSAELQKLLDGMVGESIQGAAIFDGKGKALAAKLGPGIDATALGSALVGTQFQAQHALRQIPAAGPPRALLMEFEGRLLTMAAVPGPALVVLLLAPGTEPAEGLKRVRDAAQRVWRSSQA